MIVEAVVAVALALRPAPAIEVPGGYRAEVFATGLRRPTALAWGPDGRLYATQETGEIVHVGRGSARPRVVGRGFRTPLGLAWLSPRTLFVSTKGALYRMRLEDGHLVGRRALVTGLPYGRHQQNNVVLANGRVWFGSGSTCDVCSERDRRSGAILSVRFDGSGLRVVARGLRNPYGLVYADGLYATVNGRDDLGTWEPAEAVVRVRQGAHFGWPGCWPSWRLRRLVGACRGVSRPLAYLEPHSAAGSIIATSGNSFLVTEWGQYDSRRFGRKVVRIDRTTGRVTVFARGFDHPLALTTDPAADAVLVGDWGRGIIYRIVRRVRGA